MDVFLTCNSPGELSSWVAAVAPALKRQNAEVRVTVALVPCPYATGAEARVARGLEGVDRVLTPWQTTLLLLGCKGLPRHRRAVVGYLGGELLHALWLGRRLGIGAVGYLEKPSGLAARFRAVAVARPEVAEALPVPSHYLGDLMVDGVLRHLPAVDQKPTVALFPGSRAFHLRATLAPFLRACELLQQRQPGWEYVMAVSPFVESRHLIKALQKPLLPTDRTTGEVEGDHLVSRGGVRVKLLRDPYEAIARTTFAICIPGTNTAQLACAGRPMIVCVHASAIIGGGGLFGLLDRLPLGPFNRWLRRRKRRRLGLLALPNIRAGEQVAPELVVDNSLQNLVAEGERLMSEPERRRTIANRLKEVMGPPGAAEGYARLLLESI